MYFKYLLLTLNQLLLMMIIRMYIFIEVGRNTTYLAQNFKQPHFLLCPTSDNNIWYYNCRYKLKSFSFVRGQTQLFMCVMFQASRVSVMVRAALLLLAVALCRAATLDSELGVGKSINIFMR